MIEVSDEQFQELIDEALGKIPGQHVKNIKNIAILWEDYPTPEQRTKTLLQPHQTLLGLYEGLPLTQRQGNTRLLPDKITLFKVPLLSRSDSIGELKEEIKHTLWHEIAHYYGLNHDQIKGLE